MSVLKAFRDTSNMQFITTAANINKTIIRLIIKLSNKYTKVMEEQMMNSANQIISNVLKANSIRALNQKTFDERRDALLEAKHYTHLLNVQVGIVLDMSLSNDPNEKLKSVENLLQTVGEQLEDELKLIEGLLASDLRRFREASRKGSTSLSE